MIKLETNLARQAMKLPEFRDFMVSEMGISEKELRQLSSCGACWNNTKFLPRSIEKINEYLLMLAKAGKIKKSRMAKTLRFDTPEKAIEYIKEIGNPEVIFITYQK